MKTCETCKDDSCFDMGSQRSACDAYAPDADEVENVEDPLAVMLHPLPASRLA